MDDVGKNRSKGNKNRMRAIVMRGIGIREKGR